jgi:hypothetical protein
MSTWGVLVVGIILGVGLRSLLGFLVGEGMSEEEREEFHKGGGL